MGDQTDRHWVPLRDAAKALGVSKETVRQRFKAGALDGRRDNHGRILVALPADLVATLATMPGARAAKVGRQGGGLAPSVEAVLTEKDRTIARLEGEVAWLRAELERRRWPGLWPALQRFWRGEA